MKPNLQRYVQRHGWDRASSCYDECWQQQLQPALDVVLDTADLQAGRRRAAWSAEADLGVIAADPRIGPPPRDIGTVIWATGNRPDHSWLDVPVLDHKGRIRHDGGSYATRWGCTCSAPTS